MRTTSSRPRFVVDASVATKWQLRDEPSVAQAEAMLVAFRDGRIDLLAPHSIRFEVPSAIRKTLRTGRLTPDQARGAIRAFLDLRLPTVDRDGLIVAAYEQTLRFGCSLYDGMYLALAESAGCPLVHADLRLRNALARHPTSAIWLDDWSL